MMVYLMQQAVEENLVEELRTILESGADPNMKSAEGGMSGTKCTSLTLKTERIIFAKRGIFCRYDDATTREHSDRGGLVRNCRGNSKTDRLAVPCLQHDLFPASTKLPKP
jgi:hypothetical protein